MLVSCGRLGEESALHHGQGLISFSYGAAVGGVWINFGPLLYHWATTRTSPSDGNDGLDERYHRSVELTWEELRHVILSYGFRLER